MNWIAETYKKIVGQSIPQPLCHNLAHMAAETLWENQIPCVLVWDSPVGKPGHMQCKAILPNGEEVWISAKAQIWVGTQEKEWEGEVFQKPFGEEVQNGQT